MLLLLNTFCFYSLTACYFSWFRNVDTRYISYCNSTFNSVVVLLAERIVNPSIATELLTGYLLYDIGHMAHVI